MSTHGAFRFVILIIGCALCAPAAATTVYTWTDAQGVRHFSQYPPAETEQRTETVTLDALESAPDADDRLQTVRDVARDLEQARLQREQQRAKPAPSPSYERGPPAAREPPPVLVVPYPGYPTHRGPWPQLKPYPPQFGPRGPRLDRPDTRRDTDMPGVERKRPPPKRLGP